MTDILNVTFVLPGSGHLPVGGMKAVYEYANHLSRRGHKVVIVHSSLLNIDAPALGVARSFARYLYRKGTGNYRPRTWFPLDASIQILWTPSLSAKYLPNADVVIATAWQTAEWVTRYPRSKGRPFYLIQHLETWSGPEDRVYATWKLPLRKIVVAKWLQQIASRLGEESVHIPYGLDFTQFSRNTMPDQRSASHVMMLYHDLDWKGSADGLNALSLVRNQVRDLKVTLFGTPKPSATFPSWIRYYRNPPQDTLRDLYNEASIFVAPSWTEGWGLPGTEAMMCGAALSATETTGHLEFAIHEETALLSPVKQPQKLAENIVRLIQDDSLRIRLANHGHRFVQQFTWQRATDSLEKLLLENQ